MENNHLVALGAATLLTVLAVYLLAKPNDRDVLDRETLLEFLDILARRWFISCRDIAELSRSIRQKLMAQKVNLSEEEFKDQLLHQCGVLKKLEEIQHEVLKEFNKDEEIVQSAQTEYEDDSKVKAYTEGCRTMLEDSVKGRSPIMPNMEIPTRLTEQTVLDICAQMQEVEIRRVYDHFEKAGGFLPNAETLGHVLALANKEAETRVLEKNESELVCFYSSLETYQRRSPSFSVKKTQLDIKHRDRMVSMFKREPGTAPSSTPTSTMECAG